MNEYAERPAVPSPNPKIPRLIVPIVLILFICCLGVGAFWFRRARLALSPQPTTLPLFLITPIPAQAIYFPVIIHPPASVPDIPLPLIIWTVSSTRRGEDGRVRATFSAAGLDDLKGVCVEPNDAIPPNGTPYTLRGNRMIPDNSFYQTFRVH